MNKQYKVSAEELKKSRIPHEILLTNLTFNHILLFVALLSASSMWKYVVLVPIFSVLSLLYIFFAAKRAQVNSSWFVHGHWQVTLKRSKIFLLMILAVSCVFVILFTVSGGDFKPIHWALGGATILPVMVTVLILVVLESDALYQAKQAVLPDWIEQRFKDNVPEVIGIIDHNDPKEMNNNG